MIKLRRFFPCYIGSNLIPKLGPGKEATLAPPLCVIALYHLRVVNVY